MENNENKKKQDTAQNESNSAKRLKMLGDDMSEDIHLESDAEVKGDKWANIWYRYKWTIILVAIALVMLIILALAMCGEEKTDLNIMYVGPVKLTGTYNAMSDTLNKMCDDYDGNGESVVNLATIQYQSPEYREKNPDNLLSNESNADNLTQFEVQVMSGEVAIYLIDPYLYDVKAKAACVPISEVLGYELDSSMMYDESAVYFSKTDFAIYFNEFDTIPQNTLICVVKTAFTDSDNYENSIDYFKKIIEFDAP